MLFFAISATVRNFLSTLPFSFLLSRVKRKMYLLSPYQQRGRPSGFVCVLSELRNEDIWEPLNYSPSTLLTRYPDPDTNPAARKLPAVVTFIPSHWENFSSSRWSPYPFVCSGERWEDQGSVHVQEGFAAGLLAGNPCKNKVQMSSIPQGAWCHRQLEIWVLCNSERAK